MKLFRPSKEEVYEHINELFSGEIDWELIQNHYPDMMRVAMSIKAGKITPSTILNKLGTYSKKNKLYQAFRELGRVIRTTFLLQYMADAELRSTIQSATNKSEAFNGFTKWLFFGGGLLPNTEALQQRSWTGSPTEQWYLRDKGSNNYEIVNQGTQKVASYEYMWASRHIEYVDLDEANPSDSNRVFNISNNVYGADLPPISIPGMENFVHGTFSLPTLPATGTRLDAPGEDPNKELPQSSNPVVVGASLIPCIMVNDSQVSDYTKIHNTPYYTLIKEEYWEKAASTVLAPSAKQSIAFKTGISSSDQQKMTETISMKVGADFGFTFLDKIGPLKAEISRTLQTETSTTSTELSEETATADFTGEAGKTKGYTLYQLATKYTLKRADGSVASGSWTVKNKKVTVLRASK